MARFGIDYFFPFAFSSYSIMDVSLPQCTSIILPCKLVIPQALLFPRLSLYVKRGINCRPDLLTNLDKSRSRRPDSVQPSQRSCRIPGS